MLRPVRETGLLTSLSKTTRRLFRPISFHSVAFSYLFSEGTATAICKAISDRTRFAKHCICIHLFQYFIRQALLPNATCNKCMPKFVARTTERASDKVQFSWRISSPEPLTQPVQSVSRSPMYTAKPGIAVPSGTADLTRNNSNSDIGQYHFH